MGINSPSKRVPVRIVASLFCVAVSAAVVGIWLSHVNADLPPEKKVVDVREMSVKERAELGEMLIFGMEGGSEIRGAIGKAQCPLCHGFRDGVVGERAPNLFGITTRAWERLKDPRYHLGKPNERNTIQKEAFPGAGTATTAIEYIAESAICPSCYVVAGFGVKGTNDRESPGVKLHKPPISLSIDELIAVNTWLYVHDGNEPPSPQEIEQAYRKFIPQSEWPYPSSDPEIYPGRYGPPTRSVVPVDLMSNLTGKEPIDEIFTKAACIACHTIPGVQRPVGILPPIEQLRNSSIVPGVQGAVGLVGPPLNMKTTALERLKASDYKGKATNIREYIIESIVDPSIYVVEGYPDNFMPKDYGKRLAGPVIERMVDYLSQLE